MGLFLIYLLHQQWGFITAVKMLLGCQRMWSTYRIHSQLWPTDKKLIRHKSSNQVQLLISSYMKLLLLINTDSQLFFFHMNHPCQFSMKTVYSDKCALLMIIEHIHCTEKVTERFQHWIFDTRYILCVLTPIATHYFFFFSKHLMTKPFLFSFNKICQATLAEADR